MTQRTRCSVWSRSMGFIRPVENFNIGKYQEYLDRNMFTEANALAAGNKHKELLKAAQCM